MTDTRVVRSTIFRTLADEGRAPSALEISASTGLEPAVVRAALEQLGREHAIVLAPDGETVRMAHPFAARPMGFVVSPLDGRDDRLWWGGCAWDSFGIVAALGIDAVVTTKCPHCGARLGVEVAPDRPPGPDLAVRFPTAARFWWDDVVATCSAIRLFCGTQHAEAFDVAARSPGRVVPAETVWSLAGPWYGDRLDSTYLPRTAVEKQRMLADAGLRGDFWRLE